MGGPGRTIIGAQYFRNVLKEINIDGGSLISAEIFGPPFKCMQNENRGVQFFRDMPSAGPYNLHLYACYANCM